MDADARTFTGTIVVDQRGDLRMCSESLAQAIGRPAAELVGEAVWTLLPGWSPFEEEQSGSSLRVSSGHESVPVRLVCEALHLPGETLFVVNVLGRLAEAPAVRAEVDPQ